MNMRAAFPLAAGPQTALAEPVMVALAEGVSAVFLDGGKGAARGRLTCTLDGAPAAAPCLGTSLELADGGLRHLALLGQPLGTLLDRRLALALDGRAVALADPAWLQPPVRDTQALVERLTPGARLRFLRLLLTTGASLFLRGRPAYPGLVREMLALAGSEPVPPIARAAFGEQVILTYRLGAAPEPAGDPFALSAARIRPLKGAALHFEARAGLLHLHLPQRLEGEAVILAERPLRLAAAPADLAPLPATRWAAGRDAGASAWLAERLRGAEGRSPALGAVARELRPEAVQPVARLLHLSQTPAGLVHALELTDPEGFVRAVRYERGGARVEVASTLRLDGAGTLAGFARLPEGEVCRVSLVHHSGRLRLVHDGAAPRHDGRVPPGFAAARAEALAAGRADTALAALAEARATMARRDLPVRIQAFGAVEAPSLTLLAPAGELPDVIRARAALVFAERGGRRAEIVLTVPEGPRAVALRRIVGEVAAIAGLAHRIVTHAPDATPAEALRAGLGATRGDVLLLGPEVLPEGRGWLAAWRKRLGRAEAILGGVLLAADGSILAGGSRFRGLPRDLAPKGRRASAAFSDEAVGLTRAGVARLLEARSGHPDPATLLAALAAEERAAGRTTATDFALACRRYAPTPQDDALAAELRAADLARASGAAA
jgi:hypothetical protein